MLVSCIGTRSLSAGWKQLIVEFSRGMAEAEWMIRSGAAEGCDQAWTEGFTHRASSVSLYLPWPTFNKSYWFGSGYRIQHNPTEEGARIARDSISYWDSLKQGAKKLYARNSHIILGPDCRKPSDLVVAYTTTGDDRGGTGQAIRIARAKQIPVLNIHWPSDQRKLQALLEGTLCLSELPC